ncbi:MAG: hypothetical protein EOM91_11375 [Sphingobacteriia bacterium]|nr:hypothetical protein [Sphingobacteriia bacterium]NCC38199.1 hypothetical protein [Gammaproteobacteria bacterium]
MDELLIVVVMDRDARQKGWYGSGSIRPARNNTDRDAAGTGITAENKIQRHSTRRDLSIPVSCDPSVVRSDQTVHPTRTTADVRVALGTVPSLIS